MLRCFGMQVVKWSGLAHQAGVFDRLELKLAPAASGLIQLRVLSNPVFASHFLEPCFLGPVIALVRG